MAFSFSWIIACLSVSCLGTLQGALSWVTPIHYPCTQVQSSEASCDSGNRCIVHVLAIGHVRVMCVEAVSYDVLIRFSAYLAELERNHTTGDPVIGGSLHGAQDPTPAGTPTAGARGRGETGTDSDGDMPMSDDSWPQRDRGNLSGRSSMGATGVIRAGPSMHRPNQYRPGGLDRPQQVIYSKTDPAGRVPLSDVLSVGHRPDVPHHWHVHEPHLGGGVPPSPWNHIVQEACVACRRPDTRHLSFRTEVLTKDRICRSDFVFRVRAIHSRGNQHSVQIMGVYRLKRLPVTAAPNVTDIFLENRVHPSLNTVEKPCNCNFLRPGGEYLMMGQDDVVADRLTVTSSDLVLAWSNKVGKRTRRLAPLCFQRDHHPPH